MKFAGLLVLLIVGQASANADKTNPISRVVDLLEGLVKKITADGKMEDDLYETYMCWAKNVIKTKTAAVEEAKSRIEELTAYVDDIESGRIEFTSERGDLEDAIKGLNEELESAKDMRDKEHNDFLAAKDEMEKGIAALEEAVEVLAAGTKGSMDFVQKKGSLLAERTAVSRVVQAFKEGEHTGAEMKLQHAIELGKNYLSKGDALFLERLLSGDVHHASQNPPTDWKKLNRKSTFKMKYKARSGKIQTILADMLQTFKDNLADATKKEKEALENYERLSKSKGAQLSDAQKALTDGEKEGAARGASKEDAEKEIEDLKAQVAADEKTIADTDEAMKTKLGEWKERKKLRTLEIASIEKAIAILDSDEARETFQSSMKSQGYLLLQKSAKSAVRDRVSSLLRQVGASAKDPRMNSLALTVLLQAKGPIDDVIKAIDDMVETLKEEEEADLETKETCESEREEDTKKARDLSIEIDDYTDVITRNTARIAELKEEIEKLEAAIKAMKEDLEKAKRTREDEKAAFEAGLADDEAAAGLIKKAKETLQGFYEDNGLTLLQDKKVGQAPPPPTPEGGYGGAKGESTGIQAILQMILEDVEADIEKSKKQEKEAIAEYEKFKKETEASIEANQKSIEDHKGEVADCEKTIEDTKGDRLGAKGALDSVMKTIFVKAPNCEFMTVNFPVRLKNRQMEIDGLLKAKAILQGAAFGL